MKPPSPTSRADALLLATTIALLIGGLGMVFTASAYIDAVEFGRSYATVLKQAVATIGGLVIMFVLARTPYRKLRTWWKYVAGAWILSLFGMGAVLVFGREINGAKRWINIGPVNVQPSEFVKFTSLLLAAVAIDKFRDRVNDRHFLGIFGFGAFWPLALLVLQKDLGTIVILCGMLLMMLFLAGLSGRIVAALFGSGIGLVALLIAIEPYRMRRITTLFDPFADCTNDGYQVCQSLVAFHNGGLRGQGAGEGYATLDYLPEAHNDFIAAVIGEQAGFLGILLLITMFAVFTWRGVTTAHAAKDFFGFLLSATITLMIAGQACMNLGVALGLFPNKGLVLPFLSYGGSAMVVNLAAVGVLLAVSAGNPRTAPATSMGAAEVTVTQRSSTGA